MCTDASGNRESIRSILAIFKNMEPVSIQNTPPSPDPWDLIIAPRRHLLDLHLDDLWRYRDLVLLFVRRDFVAVYKQTVLGPLWYLIQPLLTTITFTFIFGQVAQLPTDGLPQFLFYMSGTVIWTYFADCIVKTSNTFVNNAQLFGKVYFPRLAVPVSILISNLITFGIQFALFLLFIGFFALRGSVIRPNGWVLFSPVLVFMMAGLGLGFGIIISSLTASLRSCAATCASWFSLECQYYLYSVQENRIITTN